jgi:hypothetical protein
LLEQFVERNCGELVGETTALRLLIKSRQGELRAAALTLGARLYAEPPTAICGRLENYWNAWREK